MVRPGTLITGVALLLAGCRDAVPGTGHPALDEPLSKSKGLVAPTDLIAGQASLPHAFVIDARTMEAYRKGHIPGAVQLWRDALTRHDLPYPGMAAARDTVRHLLDSLGLQADQPVVVYDDRGGCDAARIWWLLIVYGHRHVQLLDGGWLRWTAEGRPTDTAVVVLPASGYRFPHVPDSTWVATMEEVERAHAGGVVLLDTRSEEEHTGAVLKQGALRPGTIPGSVHYDWGNAVAFDKNQCMKDADVLRDQLSSLGVGPEDTVITFCHSGVRSAHTAFMLTQVLGFKHVRNYGGSWTEWSHAAGMPVEVKVAHGDLP